MREYGAILKGDDQEAGGRATANKVLDAAEFLDSIGLIDTPPALIRPIKLAYHDACHLAHGQSVRGAPRRLLESVGNVELVELNDGEVCCGSAGTYNLDQPEIAAELGRRKAEAVVATGADAVVAGNVGCMVQISAHLENLQKKRIAGGSHDAGTGGGLRWTRCLCHTPVRETGSVEFDTSQHSCRWPEWRFTVSRTTTWNRTVAQRATLHHFSSQIQVAQTCKN